jgi:hypothetical protein
VVVVAVSSVGLTRTRNGWIVFARMIMLKQRRGGGAVSG